MAALAPIPSASVRITVIARPLVRAKERSATLRSRRNNSGLGIILLLRSWLLRRCQTTRASGRAIEQQIALAGVARESGRALELGTCLIEAAELEKKVAANAGQEVVTLQRRL